MRDHGFFELRRERYRRYIPLHVDQWVGLACQSMNSDTERGGTRRGVGIGVSQDEGETKTRGEGIDNIFVVF
jgi:hypothetical protein